MVRELSKHQCCFLFDCCIVIERFALLSCYSSAKTRIRPVKLYQINNFFLHNALCIAVHCVSFDCCFDAFWVSGAPSSPIEFATLLRFRAQPEPKPAFESHFRFFTHVFPSHFCTRYYCTSASDLQERASPI